MTEGVNEWILACTVMSHAPEWHQEGVANTIDWQVVELSGKNYGYVHGLLSQPNWQIVAMTRTVRAFQCTVSLWSLDSLTC